MFTTYRLFYLQDNLGVSEADAPRAVLIGVLVYTLALVLSAYVAGKISDRTGRRKFLVAGSTLLFGIGIFALAHVDTVNGFYVVEAVLGVAFGIYVGVDLALVVDVLPNPDDAGKDLGVFNMANALPQTLAPVLGAALLAVNSANNQNYDAAALRRRRCGAGRCADRPPDQEGEVIPDAGHRQPAERADPGGEGVADQRLLLLVHRTGRAAGHPEDHGLRRTARPARPAGGRRPPRSRRVAAGDLLPDRLGDRLGLEPRAVGPDR